MKRKKKYWIYIFVFIQALFVFYYGSELLAIYRLGLVKVCVANHSLPQRTMINEENITYIKVPKAYINDECYLKKEEIIGKYVKLDAYIPKGSIFYKDFLQEKDEMKDYLHLGLAEDETTYDLFVRDIKVNPAHLSKDMNVDLYLTVRNKEIYSDLLLSGTRITGLYDINNKEIRNNSDDAVLATISIAVKKDMVPYLNKAIAIGEVSLLVSSDPYASKQMYLNSSSEIFKLLS